MVKRVVSSGAGTVSVAWGFREGHQMRKRVAPGKMMVEYKCKSAMMARRSAGLFPDGEVAAAVVSAQAASTASLLNKAGRQPKRPFAGAEARPAAEGLRVSLLCLAEDAVENEPDQLFHDCWTLELVDKEVTPQNGGKSGAIGAVALGSVERAKVFGAYGGDVEEGLGCGVADLYILAGLEVINEAGNEEFAEASH
ncbi:hypothetical protein HDU96_008678 [Phlyctochytrium bullatum]|nr:hypothetical protein HDU96_008678 [Phlyctochytrium bullatum]